MKEYTVLSIKIPKDVKTQIKVEATNKHTSLSQLIRLFLCDKYNYKENLL